MAPSNVTARITRTMNIIKSNGIIHLFAFSIPFWTPNEITSTFANVNKAKPTSVIQGVPIIFPNSSAGSIAGSMTAPVNPSPL